MSTSHFECLVQSAIVMKGYPFTRKTQFAEMIAKSIGCPVLSSEDILDCLTPPLSSDQEFEVCKVICKIASRQLRNRSRDIVIDFPLSSQSNFIHLLNFLPIKVGVIVIECKPTHTCSWKLKFEQHLARHQSQNDEVKWYKPMKWEDVEKAIQQHPDYDVTSLSPKVSKLVVDPLLDCPDSWHYDDTLSGLVAAVKYMMESNRCINGRPSVVVYQQWLQQSKQPSSSSSDPHHCSKHGHDIVPNSTVVELQGNQYETVDCLVCGKQVTRSDEIGNGYCYCKNCSLTLHMECTMSRTRGYANTYAGMLSIGCKPCMKVGKDFSNQCMTCKFEYDIKISDPHPVAIKHFDTKEHFLTKLYFNYKEGYRCFACGGNTQPHMYVCKDCGITYHYECATMPRRVKNVHGGHHHYMSLNFWSEEEGDHLCQECQELMDPRLWYYSCQDCPGYELHPYCVAKLGEENGREMMDYEEILAAGKFEKGEIKMKESESISDFYSRVIYLIQWYGKLRDEAEFVWEILGSLPSKFYHAIVAIKRSKEYESMSMTVDQLMISLRVYEKKIDNGEDVLIEQVLANLYATQQSSSTTIYYNYWSTMSAEDEKLIMNAKDVSLKLVLDTNYSKQESGDNWIKYWGKYWDKYWFNYKKGYYSSQDESKVQCSICYMFGHGPRHCWSVLDTVIVGPRIVQSQSNRSSPEMELDPELRL